MEKNRYKDLEDLLYLGFIPCQVRIGDIDFVFKSISDLEYRKTILMSGIKGTPQYTSKFHRNYLYHSLYMINGESVLEKRESYRGEIIDVFKTFPSFIFSKVFKTLDSISLRLNSCVNLVEPYSYENESRYSWISKRNTILNSYQQTGIRGTEELGLNQFQKYWTVLNLREDSKESFEEKYSLIKFLASFTDPKSVRKIDGQDKAKKEEEEKKRERIKITGTEEEKLRYNDPTATREGIITELEKQIRGDKDDHDRAIEDLEKKLRSNMLKQMQELKSMQDDRKKDESIIDEARPISREEMLSRINKTKNTPRVFMRSIDENESKYMEMSNVRTEDVLEESGLTRKGYNSLVDNEMFNGVHKHVPDKDDFKVSEGTYVKDTEGSMSSYLSEQKRLASKIGIDEEDTTNFDFPNLRNR
jgi:hypothetical protein